MESLWVLLRDSEGDPLVSADAKEPHKMKRRVHVQHTAAATEEVSHRKDVSGAAGAFL